jgi:hypothetical protein
MAIQDSNPITGNTNLSVSEFADGHIAADRDSGLIFGDRQLPANIDPDKWYESLVGYPRPSTWKDDLQAVVDAHDESLPNDDGYASAKDVLNGDTSSVVYVTSRNFVNALRQLGAPDAVEIGAVLHDKDVNVSTLPYKNQTDEEGLNKTSLDTANTIAARGGVDILAKDQARIQTNTMTNFLGKPLATDGNTGADEEGPSATPTANAAGGE